MIAKAGLGLIGLGAISVGGVALTNPGWLGMDYMPKWHSLSEDNDFNNASYNEDTKLGKKYGRYLVGTTHKKDSNPQQTNESWWEWAFRKMSKDISSSKFSTKGPDAKVKFGKEASNSLKKACEEAYKLADDDNSFSENDENGSKYKKSDVWKYCSVGGKQPQTIKEFNTGSNQEAYTENSAIAGVEEEKGKLLSINSENNKWVWDLKDKDFQSATGLEGYFKTEKESNPRKHIKDICAAAYNKKEVESGADKLQKNDVIKYCGL